VKPLVTGVVGSHLAAQAGVRKSWGREFGVYTIDNVDATQICSRRGSDARSSVSFSPRVHAVYNIGGASHFLLEDLGFAPSVTLKQGLRAWRDWMADVGA